MKKIGAILMATIMFIVVLEISQIAEPASGILVILWSAATLMYVLGSEEKSQ
jgi:hypothetical protein